MVWRRLIVVGVVSAIGISILPAQEPTEPIAPPQFESREANPTPPPVPPNPPGDGRSRDNGDRGRDRERDGSSRRDSPPSSSQPPGKTKSKVRVGRIGPKAYLPPTTLPAQYAVRDSNKDGQIGMYEWSKTDLSTFNRLDLNKDGFLTPAELASPTTGGTSGSTTVAGSYSPTRSYGPGPTVSASSPPRSSTPTTVTSPAPAAPSAPPADLKVVAAESAFDFLDKDKDGALSAEELERSRNAKKLFAEAKLEITYPFSKQKFVENYVKLSK